MTPTAPVPDSSTPDPSTPDDPADCDENGVDDTTAYSTVPTELRRLRSLRG